jgi:hypothetical protein
MVDTTMDLLPALIMAEGFTIITEEDITVGTTTISAHQITDKLPVIIEIVIFVFPITFVSL